MAVPEAEIVRAALDHGIGYIGLVASKIRGASILDSLDLPEVERARVRTPVGLSIGAKTPAEIAVSIAAEVIAALRRGDLGQPMPVTSAAREAVDPVCGMRVAVGPATEHLLLADVEYWFCSPGCRTAYAGGETGT